MYMSSRYLLLNYFMLGVIVIFTGGLLLQLCRLYSVRESMRTLDSYDNEVEILINRMNHINKISRYNFNLLQKIEDAVHNSTKYSGKMR